MSAQEPHRRRPRHASRPEPGRDGGHRDPLADDPASASHPSLLGTLPPRDAFFLNPYTDVRFTRCPRCEHRTWRRKMPLFIVVEGFGALILGKTGPYCSECHLVITHRDELEGELTTIFGRLAPDVVGPEYTVLGTVELRAWRRGLHTATTGEEVLRHTAPFTTEIIVEYTPATWLPARPPGKGRSE
jgi:hypothetical protein